MTPQEFDDMLLEVVKSGVGVTMSYNEGTLWYNMNTGMKSDLYIALIENVCVAVDRYDHKATIESLEDLVDEVRCCDYGRGFFNEEWKALLEAK